MRQERVDDWRRDEWETDWSEPSYVRRVCVCVCVLGGDQA